MEIVYDCKFKKEKILNLKWERKPNYHTERDQSQQTLHKKQVRYRYFFFTKFKIKITPQFCKAGSGYALRKTAGSGSAKNAADPKAILIHTEWIEQSTLLTRRHLFHIENRLTKIQKYSFITFIKGKNTYVPAKERGGWKPSSDFPADDKPEIKFSLPCLGCWLLPGSPPSVWKRACTKGLRHSWTRASSEACSASLFFSIKWRVW